MPFLLFCKALRSPLMVDWACKKSSNNQSCYFVFLICSLSRGFLLCLVLYCSLPDPVAIVTSRNHRDFKVEPCQGLPRWDLIPLPACSQQDANLGFPCVHPKVYRLSLLIPMARLLSPRWLLCLPIQRFWCPWSVNCLLVDFFVFLYDVSDTITACLVGKVWTVLL